MALKLKKQDPPLKVFVFERLAELGITPTEMLEKIYGRNSAGEVINSGPFYAILKGTARLTPRKAGEYAAVLNCKPEDLLALRPAKLILPTPRSTPAQFAVELAEQGVVSLPAPAKKDPAQPPQFSLVIDHSGLAVLRINLIGVPLDQAMQVVQTLHTIGLLQTPGEQHQKRAAP